MAKALVIAEKPSVGRDIARVLGAKQKGEGFLFCDRWIVSWAIGHLVSLCNPEEINPIYKKWSTDTLPILPEKIKSKVLPKTRSQFSVLKKLMNNTEVDRIVCATDSGREGELIFRYIYDQAGCKKPVDRLWISSMTDAAIREGFEQMKPSSDYDGLYRSARCRSEADWLVGMNASRAFTLKYGALLSIGRVQTPTLNLLVSRDREIEAFVPEPYWEIEADFGDYTGLWINPKNKKTQTKDEQQARQIKQEVQGQPAQVIQASSERKKVPSPQLFDLTTLQREVNRMMGLSASATLKAAQALYEKHKLITYPRTDSRYLPRDMASKLRQAIAGVPEPFAAFAKPILEQDKLPMSFRIFNDKKITDHHAIVSTGKKKNLDALAPTERKLYEMIIRRMLSVFYPDYEYESMQIITQAANHDFKSSGSTPIVLGWKALYQVESAAKKEKENEKQLPHLHEGDSRQVAKVSIHKKQTKPPEAHTDASLLGAMEHADKQVQDEEAREAMKQSGLGTPATRAAIIERLIEVGYAKRSGKKLISTEKGRQLIAVVPEQIRSAETTGKWEKWLSDIAYYRGDDPEQLPERFMQGIRRYSTFLVDAAASAPTDVIFEKEASKGKYASKSNLKKLGRPCPLCGKGEVQENSKAFGCSEWKNGCKFTIWKDVLKRAGGNAITASAMDKLLSGETIVSGNVQASLQRDQLMIAPQKSDRQ